MATDTIVNAALPIAVFVMMFALGIGLKLADFQSALRSPKALLVGMSTQLLAVPALGFVFVVMQSLDAQIALGIVILTLCPGGAMSNVLTRIAGGDVALSVSLTAITNLLSVATLPALTVIAANYFSGADVDRMDIRQISQRVVLIVTVPVLLGTLLRHSAPRLIERYERAVFRMSLVFFSLIIAWAFVESLEALLQGIVLLGWQLALLTLLLLGLGFGMGRMFGLSPAQRTTVTLETGVQNSGLGLSAAVLLWADPSGLPLSATPSVVYSAIIYAFLVPCVLLRPRTS